MQNEYQSVRPIFDPSRLQVYIETYGCQMNVNDSEVVLSILQKAAYALCDKIEDGERIQGGRQWGVTCKEGGSAKTP